MLININMPPTKCFLCGYHIDEVEKMHHFPSNDQKSKIWQEAMGIKMPLVSLRNYLICSRHFTEDSYNNLNSRRLRKDAVPSLFSCQLEQDEQDWCCVPGCESTGVTLHRFPRGTEKVLFQEWIKRIRHPKLSTLEHEQVYRIYRVCENHFLQCCRSPGQKKLKPYSLPTLNLPDFQLDSTEENSFLYPEQQDIPPLPTRGVEIEQNIAPLTIVERIEEESEQDAPKETCCRSPGQRKLKPYSVPTLNLPNFQLEPTITNSFLYPGSQKESSELVDTSKEKLDVVYSIIPNLGNNQNNDGKKVESSTNATAETIPMPVQRFTKMCRLCLSRKVNEQDEMPKHICKECYKQLVKTYLFRKKAALSDKILRRHLQRSYAEGSVTLPKNCPEKNLICSDKSDDKHTTNDRNTCTPQSSSKDNLAVIQDITSKSNNSSSGVTTLGFAYSSVSSERPKTKANRICDNPTTESKVERKVNFAESVSTIETKVASVNSHKKIVLDLSNAPIRNDETENVKSAICCEKTEPSPENTKTRKVNTKPRVILNVTKQLYQCNVCKKCFIHLKALKNHKLLHVTEKSSVLVDLT